MVPATLDTDKTPSSRRYINHAGKILDFQNAADSYREGMLPIFENGSVGFANLKGEVVITPQFQATGGFSEGLASVKVHGKWGYIDKSGKMVIEPNFIAAYPFSCGKAVVSVAEHDDFRDSPGPPHHL